MRKGLICIIFCLVAIASSCALAIDYGAVFVNDVVIGGGESINGGTIIDASITIENYGTVTGRLDICAGCTVSIRNRGGTVDADVILGAGARLVQLISDADDIVSINTHGAPYELFVDGADISLNRILDISHNSSGIVFNNAKLYMDGPIAHDAFSADIRFIGDVVIQVQSIDDVVDMGFLRDARVDGRIIIVSLDSDTIFGAQVSRVDGQVIVDKVRVTDYAAIFGDVRGDFLNALRLWNPSDPLLTRLDAATSRSALESIMARSVRMRPINLMRGVRVVNSLETLDAFRPVYHSNMFASPVWIQGADMDVYGFRMGADIRVSDGLKIGAVGYAGIMDYGDDINEYSAQLYGANIWGDYDMKIAFVRGIVGATYAMFDVGPVLDGNGVAFNPDGISVYAGADVGHTFNFAHDVYVAPFVGIAADMAHVLSVSQTDAYLRAGADAGASYKVDGLRYDYLLRMTVNDASYIGAALHVSVWSEMDDAGGEFTVSTTRDELGRAYKVSIGGKYKF